MRGARTVITGWLCTFLAFAKSSKATAFALVTCAAVMGRILLIQLRCLPLPLVVEEQHHWRQAFTYGVAWNYAHGLASFFRPRWYFEGSVSNVVAMEAPIYPYVCGLVMRVTGDGTFVLRLVSWLSLVAIVVVLFVWLGQDRRRSSEGWADRAGLFLAVGMSVSAGADFRSIQPDALAAGLAMGAAYFFSRYAARVRPLDLAVAATLTSLAVLTKPVVLGVVPALALFGAWRRERWLRHALIVGGAVTLAVVPHVLWDRWAVRLLEEVGGVIIISIQHDPKEMLAHLRNQGYVREAALQLLPSYAASWWLVPAIVAGVYRATADPRLRRFGVPFLVWLAGYLVELIAFGDRLRSNYYYFVLGPAPLAFFAATGVGALVDVLSAPRPRPSIVTYRAGIITALSVLGPLFSVPADWRSADHGALSFHKTWRVWTDDLRLALLLAGILLALGVAPLLRKRTIPSWLGVALFAGFLVTAIPGVQNSWQFLRHYSAMERRPSYVGVPELRAIVARHTSPSDRIIISEIEPIYVHYAGRNAVWSLNPTPAQVADARSRGARLYVHLRSAPPPSPPGRHLASGSWWHVYCTAADDCPAR